ncbi:hypothetical protein [Vreelandella arcis]|uniref:Uncharacterized protein n=1 Tax=Vreelandella arcis TaxID=416873 RepID=A0A1H0IA63_9GAMM|nr:hypothetical protein [Halomonas arcis]SDO28246.1 hypothetical protein SAMN04487951_11917 [Halomonas arcis]
MNQKRPFPDEIKQRWDSAVKPLNLSSAQQQYITQLVRYAQPPLTLDGFRLAATFYDHDCDPDSHVEAKLLTSALSTAKEAKLGSHYPVFFALTTPRLLGSLNCPVSHAARVLLSDWFSEIEESKSVSRGNFYRHLLSVRHILRIIIDAGWHEKSPYETHSSYFLDAIRSKYLQSPRSRNEQHYNVFVALATHALSPGGIIRDTGNGGGGKGTGSTEKKSIDAWHAEHLKRCVTVPSPKRRRVSTAKHDAQLLSPHQLTDPELRAMGLQHKTPKTPQRSTSEEETEATTLQRSTASTLTRHDDRRFAQRWTSAAPTSSLATVSDLSRLPPLPN